MPRTFFKGRRFRWAAAKLAAKVRSRTEVRGWDTEKKEPIGEFGVSDEAKEFHLIIESYILNGCRNEGRQRNDRSLPR